MPDADRPPADPDREPTFEASLAQIESIVSDLEGGAMDLDASLSRFEEGVRLLSRCRSTLQDAERRVSLLTGCSPDGSPLTSPFGDPSRPAGGEDD